jgi:HSP20 family molecular chaperone IbpA
MQEKDVEVLLEGDILTIRGEKEILRRRTKRGISVRYSGIC